MSMPIIVESGNLSAAWAAAFLASWRHGEIQPLVVTVTGLNAGIPQEDQAIRSALDISLVERGGGSCKTVANTIFPMPLWNPDAPASQLYRRYLRFAPRLMHSNSRNRYGMYFQRMISFGDPSMNQLEHVIETWKKGNHRRSALQVSIMDPTRDHTHQRQRGFPCLQHVIFTPDAKGGLAISGVYGTQEIFEKAYGNYLGLCNLGRYMAHELGLELTRMTCFAAVAKLHGNGRKRDLALLAEMLDTRSADLQADQKMPLSVG